MNKFIKVQFTKTVSRRNRQIGGFKNPNDPSMQLRAESRKIRGLNGSPSNSNSEEVNNVLIFWTFYSDNINKLLQRIGKDRTLLISLYKASINLVVRKENYSQFHKNRYRSKILAKWNPRDT